MKFDCLNRQNPEPCADNRFASRTSTLDTLDLGTLGECRRFGFEQGTFVSQTPLRFTNSRLIAFVTLLLSSFASLGCVQNTYRYGISRPELLDDLPRTPNLITMGGHHPRIDKLEKVVQYPGKVIRKWFPSNDPDEAIPPSERRMLAVQAASDYLDDNGLKGVNIDVREYNPGQQWSRLQSNDRIAPFWKYTGGTLYHVGYCLLPGRAFGRDGYNPFTNTLSINSTSREESVFHSAYVKKLYDQRYPGTYTAVNWLPVVPLFRDASVSSDALSYARAKQDWKLERNMYPEVYGRMGGDLVSQATSFIPGVAYLPFYTRPLLSGAGNVAGSATGEVIARQKEKQITAQAQGTNVLR